MGETGQTPQPDLEALTDLKTPWCVHTVATLGIADLLAAGPRDVNDLAAAAHCNARALHGVLIHLTYKGVFAEPAPGRFTLNEAARELFAQSQFLDLDGIGGRMAGAWGTLPSYVRTGRSAYHEAFGMGFWEDLAAHPEVAESFDSLMGPAGHGPPSPAIALARGWERVRTVVDVGGGTGAMLAAVLRARPELRGTLVDFPATIARAAPTFDRAGVADRVTATGQSFFDPLPAGADLYLLRHVLNDWPARETVAILHRCAEAARPDGSIVVMGGVAAAGVPPELSIDMLVAGGETDTPDEFAALAHGAGLSVIAAGEQPRQGYVVECVPAGQDS